MPLNLLRPSRSKDSKHNSSAPEQPPSFQDSNAIHAKASSSTTNTRSPRLSPTASRSPQLSPISSRSRTASLNATLNKPYRPSSEQQHHIDQLSSGQLSASASNTQTEYFDILPSFQMFQSILRRDDTQFTENLQVKPPIYGDTKNSSATPPSFSPQTSHVDEITSRLEQLDTYYPDNEEYVYDNDDGEGHAVPTSEEQDHESVHNHNMAVTESAHSPLDNIDVLPKATSSPIDIQIYVTKRVPQPNVANELETRLKEYTSGDVVNGYIVITNTSNKPVDFGLFTVSLEGTIKSTDRNPNSGPMDLNKYNKILMKKFLKMYDLNASYGYTQIPSSAGIEYEAYTIDPSDGCSIGLPPERVLAPLGKYKKFFTFKFPDKLLDNSCFNSLVSHIMPPPTMGLDRTCFYNRGESIQLNKVLGYGFLNTRGTPILTKDYSFEDVSLSYTIEAKFIDKVGAKEAVSEHEINHPKASSSDYVISKSSQYFLRFLPNMKHQLKLYDQWFQYGTGSFSSLGIDGKLYEDFKTKATWKAIASLNEHIEREIDERLDQENMTLAELKSKNSFPPVGSSEKHHAEKATQDHDHEHFFANRMIGTAVATAVYGKRKKKILSSLIKIGSSKLFVRVPSLVIPYASPKLLTKYNNGSMEEAELSPTQSISGVLSNDIRPVTSISSANNINELYLRDSEEVLQKLEATLVFDAVDSAKPPHIASIETNIVLWSYNTEYPLPFELGYDFFYSTAKGQTSNDDVTITRDNLQNLKNDAFGYIQYLKANQTRLSKESYLYLKSVKSLTVKKDCLKDYYKPVTAHTHPHLMDDSGWKATQTINNKIRWTKDVVIPLETINKHNVSLIPSFQSCLVGRVYCIQLVVKYKGSNSEANEFADNVVKVDVPVLVG